MTDEERLRPKKRIILLLDGTWNDQDFGETDTNIVRIQQIISDSLERRRAKLNAEAVKEGKPATALDDGTGVPNIVFYERGVGTSFWTSATGGAFGSDLPDKVRNAYRFLSFHYEPGAQIFIFGFSRGAFTARSLAGLIHASGLLEARYCTPENEKIAWKFYRTPPNARYPGICEGLTPYVHPRSTFEIACMGVFDTVGALCIPHEWFTLLNRDRYQFHNVELSSLSRLNLHALAIDERRRPFEAAVWRRPKFKQYNSKTEQVWFPGVHSDIGGSYIPEVRRPLDNPQALDDITLHWMLKRLLAEYPTFPADDGTWVEAKSGWELAEQHNSRTWFYQNLGKRTLRSIANYPIESRLVSDYNGCLDRHAVAKDEKVHISALLRLGREIKIDGTPAQYVPPNLLDVLPIISASYGGSGPGLPEDDQIRVVDWDGREFDPMKADDRKCVLDVIAAASKLVG